MRVWIASLLFYSAIFILCEVLRYIVERFCKPRNAHVGQLLLEVRTGSHDKNPKALNRAREKTFLIDMTIS